MPSNAPNGPPIGPDAHRLKAEDSRARRADRGEGGEAGQGRSVRPVGYIRAARPRASTARPIGDRFSEEAAREPRAENSALTSLAPASLEWAIAHLTRYGDTDLFPTPFEFALVRKEWASVQPKLAKIDIGAHQWGAARQIIVQKDEVAFRRTTQLDPLDAILFAAIMREIGKTIEARRAKTTRQVVFSYRFSAT
jgi:hypothetical protein